VFSDRPGPAEAIAMRSKLVVLSTDEIEAIHSATLELLQRAGVQVREPRAVRALTDAGAAQPDPYGRVRIPEALLLEGVRGIPKRWTWYARESSKNLSVGDGGRTLLGPGSACTRIVDFVSGQAREPTEKDGDELVRLMDALQYVDINYTPVSFGVSNEPQGLREVATFVRDLQNTSKPLVGPSFNGSVARDALEIAKLLAGGEESLRTRPMIAGYCDPVGPLIHDRAMTETLIEYAKLGQPVFLMCLDLAGASAPARLAGTLVQQNAELLSGALICHLVNPRAPVVYGSVSGIMDMRTGNAVVGGPEAGLLSAASMQLAHFYGLPCSGLGQSDAKIHDIQAALEKGLTLLASILAGADFVDLFFGSYQGFNATSPEQVIIDHEIAGYAHRYAAGIQVDSASLSSELLEAVGPGGDFLRDPRSLRETMAEFRTNWYMPSLFDRSPTGGASSQDLLGAAHKQVLGILAEHQPAPLDPELLAGAQAVLDRIRKTGGDGR
jgi:trimethylamine--corrinoid protein Co-methyltransferase